MKKKITAIALALILMIQLFPVTVFAAEEESFNLGDFDTATNTYKDASGSGEKAYYGISVGFSLDILGGESITLPADGDGFAYNDNLSSAYSKVISISTEGGKTAADIAAYVRQIKFNGGGAGQEVSVLLSETAFDHRTFFWGGNDHFYQYVSVETSWTSAYAAAKDMKYNGRRGYLATITTQAEDLFLSTVSSQTGWLGGTRLSVDTEAINYSATDWTTWEFKENVDAGYWYWACGPEAASGTDAAKFYTKSSYTPEADTESNSFYFNWNISDIREPNNSGGTESCLSTLTLGNGFSTLTAGYSWNDLANANSGGSELYDADGYFVEFGDQVDGDSSGSGSVVSGSLKVEGEVSGTFPAWATAAGLKNGTDAEWEGRPLPSRLKLLKDITLTNSIILPGGADAMIDLNGNTITAPAGKPAITSSSIVTLTIINSGSVNGSVLGSDGADAETGDGASGTPAISLQGNSQTILGSGVTVNGGDGGDSLSNGNGGDGAYAIAGDKASTSAENGACVIGGNGGDSAISPGVGGNGGSAIEGDQGGEGTYTDGITGKNGITQPVITTISFDGNDGIGSMTPLRAFSDIPLTLPSCGFTAPTGKQFKEWRISDSVCKKAGETYTFTASQTLQAVWEDIPSYTVTVAVKKDNIAYLGKTVTLRQGEEIKYTLTGDEYGNYSCSALAGTYSVYIDGAVTGESIEVTDAPVGENIKYYTVSFEANGGTPAPAEMVLLSGSKVAEPEDMTKETYDYFRGWYASAEFEGDAWNFDESTVTGTTTLYANWEHRHSVSVDCSSSEGTQQTFTVLDSSFTGGPLAAGNYYLTEDINLTKIIVVNGDVNLCLNGHTLKQPNGSGRGVITVESGTLSLCDCAGEGTITNGRGIGGGIYVNSKAAFIMMGGKISGNSSNDKGGGVYIAEDASFTMYGGEISKNTSGNYNVDSYGSGVYLASGTDFTMYGGKIVENSMGAEGAEAYGGGVYAENGATFIMEGGEISKNTIGTESAEAYGGGVCLESGAAFTMKDGEISGNTSGSTDSNEGYGGGVYVGTNADFTMEDGKISGNSSALFGGGVYVGTNSAFTMERGNINGNTCGFSHLPDGDGGGVYVGTNAAFNMKNGSISGNSCLYSGGGVYVDTNAAFIMEGGSISGNTGDTSSSPVGDGGGVYAKNSITLSGNAVIKNNYKNGTLLDGVYIKGERGSLNNLFLDDSTVSIAESGLTDGAQIGVSTSTIPLEGSPVSITGNNSADYHSFFTSDLSDLIIFNSGADSAQVVKLRALSSDTTLSALSYSVNGGTATPVPDFKPNSRNITVILPSSTAENAIITLTGTCSDEMAQITGNSGVTLSNGWGHAMLSVEAENGMDYMFYYIEFVVRTPAPYFSDNEDTLASSTDAVASFTLAQTPEYGTTFKIYSAEENGEEAGTAVFSGKTLNVTLSSIPSADRSYYVSMETLRNAESTRTEIKVNAHITYTISYKPNGGSGSMEDGTAVRWTEFTLPDCTFTPPAGRHFIEWAVGSADGTKIEAAGGYTFTGDTDVFATWERTDYSVTCQDGQHGSITGSTTANYDTAYSDTLVPATGYSLPGTITMTMGDAEFTDFTYDADTGRITIAANKITGNIVISGACVPNTYTIVYNGNGASGGSTTSGEHKYDEEKALTENGFIREYEVTYNFNYPESSDTSATAEYVFSGWNTLASGEGTSFADKAAVKNLSATDDDTINLHAQWTEASVTLPTPSRDKYIFGGWYSDAACSEEKRIGDGGTSYTPTAAITFYAKWTLKTYTITLSIDNKDFGAAAPGYTAPPAAETVTITNTGNSTITGYTVSADGTAFSVNYASKALAPGETDTFTVQPKAALETDLYSATVTVATAESSEKSMNVHFKVYFEMTLVIDGQKSIRRGQSTSLSANVSGGKAPYTYLWSNSETSSSITVSPDSTTVYSVTAKDALGETISESVSIDVYVPNPGSAITIEPVPNPISPQQPDISVDPTEPTGEANPEDIGENGPTPADGIKEPDTDAEPQAEDGNITVTVPVYDGEAIAKLPDEKAVVEAVLSESELELAENGASIEIRLQVKQISEEIPEADKTTIAEAIEKFSKDVPNLTIGGYLDISLLKRIDEGEWQEVSDAGKPLTIVINIPDELLGYAGYYVIRGHDGEYTLLEDQDDDPKTITILTQFFSTYAIAYREAEAETVIWPWIAAAAAAGTIALLMILLRKKKKGSTAA